MDTLPAAHRDPLFQHCRNTCSILNLIVLPMRVIGTFLRVVTPPTVDHAPWLAPYTSKTSNCSISPQISGTPTGRYPQPRLLICTSLSPGVQSVSADSGSPFLPDILSVPPTSHLLSVYSVRPGGRAGEIVLISLCSRRLARSRTRGRKALLPLKKPEKAFLVNGIASCEGAWHILPTTHQRLISSIFFP